jgi:hypothetical protein
MPDGNLRLLGNNVRVFSGVNKFVNRSLGWPDYAAHIDRARSQYHATLLIGDHYSTVSEAQFYLPDHPTVYQPTGWHPQFTLWGNYRLEPGTRALFITTDDNLSPAQRAPLSKEFGPPQLVDDFWARGNGRDIKRFHIYLLTARGDNPTSVANAGD